MAIGTVSEAVSTTESHFEQQYVTFPAIAAALALIFGIGCLFAALFLAQEQSLRDSYTIAGGTIAGAGLAFKLLNYYFFQPMPFMLPSRTPLHASEPLTFDATKWTTCDTTTVKSSRPIMHLKIPAIVPLIRPSDESRYHPTYDTRHVNRYNKLLEWAACIPELNIPMKPPSEEERIKKILFPHYAERVVTMEKEHKTQLCRLLEKSMPELNMSSETRSDADKIKQLFCPPAIQRLLKLREKSRMQLYSLLVTPKNRSWTHEDVIHRATTYMRLSYLVTYGALSDLGCFDNTEDPGSGIRKIKMAADGNVRQAFALIRRDAYFYKVFACAAHCYYELRCAPTAILKGDTIELEFTTDETEMQRHAKLFMTPGTPQYECNELYHECAHFLKFKAWPILDQLDEFNKEQLLRYTLVDTPNSPLQLAVEDYSGSGTGTKM